MFRSSIGLLYIRWTCDATLTQVSQMSVCWQCHTHRWSVLLSAAAQLLPVLTGTQFSLSFAVGFFCCLSFLSSWFQILSLMWSSWFSPFLLCLTSWVGSDTVFNKCSEGHSGWALLYIQIPACFPASNPSPSYRPALLLLLCGCTVPYFLTLVSQFGRGILCFSSLCLE